MKTKELNKKEQIFLIQKRCPDIYKIIVEKFCPASLGFIHHICNCTNIQQCYTCWNTAIEEEKRKSSIHIERK